jgi:hypothetical protein
MKEMFEVSVIDFTYCVNETIVCPIINAEEFCLLGYNPA